MRYERNMAALREILANAYLRNTKVLVYIPPIRHDAELPYVLTEYQEFKNDVEAVVSEHDADLANLENVIPDTFWGVKKSTNASAEVELDFMHFQSNGHALFAEAIEHSLREKRLIGGER